MIVNYTENGWLTITQRSHGLLAAQICGHWRKEKQPDRWVETLIATAEHDDGRDEIAEPELNENGGPKNFKMAAFERAYCDQLLEKALLKGRYVGILVSMHLRFLYAEEAAAKSYCSALAKQEKKWITETKTTGKQVRASYALLEFCDAFSLIICQGLTQPENRSMEISDGPDGTTYQLHRSENGNLVVSPWPFEVKSFQVNYESRCINELVFKSSTAFRQAMQSAAVLLHTLTISSH
jgi:hypothetical protein